MTICIPIAENSKTSPVSLKFARSNFFAIVDKDGETVKFIENPYRNLNKEVGTKLLPWLEEEYKIDTLLGFELGFKVQQAANEHKIQLIIISEKKRTLKQLLNFMNIEF